MQSRRRLFGMALSGMALSVSLLLAASTARAFTISVTGDPGADGAAGVDGGPGAPAEAIAISADATNSATARGGRGGHGGVGASGGPGGAASAVAETNVAVPASALTRATGAVGGRAGGTGERAGDGGSAVAEAVANGAGGSEARAIATGGLGGNGSLGTEGGNGGAGGAGGAASARAETNAAGPASALATANGGVGGDGGAGASGGAGRAASARAETNAAGPATALATAIGGRGGAANGAPEIAGDGGSAVAQALANGVGGSEARALAAGGSGGDGVLGAEGASGGDATLVDAVSGSDPNSLVLEQRATGGRAGSTLQTGANPLPGGRGGSATSTGDFENPGGGDLRVLLVATGGDAGGTQPGGGSAGEAGGAHVGGSVTSVGAGDATVEAVGRTGQGTTGGALVVDPLLAYATGTGDATASLEAEHSRFGSETPLSLTNRVDAIASSGAAITLRQTAIAQQAAESILDVSKSAALLDLEANAEGGDASIVVRGSNDAGSLRLSGEALGDLSFDDVDPSDARAEFEAHTSGDGHDIEIGSASRPARTRGGGGNDPVRGGDAEVIASGTALGNSAVRIDVVADGGDGAEFLGGNATARAEGSGGGTQPVDVAATAQGHGFYGAGGNATAEVLAVGPGAVTARAIARGGIHDVPPPGGAAFARARGSGASGSVAALASSDLLFDGEQADSEQVGRVQVELVGSLAGDLAIAASTHLAEFGEIADPEALDATLRAAYVPVGRAARGGTVESALLDAALAGNPRAAADVLPLRPVLPIALVELRADSGDGIAETFTADIFLGDPFSGFREFDPKPELIRFSFLDPTIDAAGFGSLTLRSFDTFEPGNIFEITFSDPLDALAFLDDGRLQFDSSVPTHFEPLLRERHLEIIFETTGAEGAFFLDFVVTAVPEPGLGLLLLLAALAVLRPGRSLFRSPMRKSGKSK